MNITEKNILMNVDADDFQAVIEVMAQRACELGMVVDRDTFVSSVLRREAETSTNMGNGISIPHGKSMAVTEPFLLFAKLRNSVRWKEGVGDENKIDLVFMIGVPAEKSDRVHLKMLSLLATRLMDDCFVQKLKTVDTDDEMMRLLNII